MNIDAHILEKRFVDAMEEGCKRATLKPVMVQNG